VIVRFVDLGGIDYHCCLEVIACFVDLVELMTFVVQTIFFEVIICFVDLDGIDNHCCLNFLFLIL
jgi:hypothetical protein